MSNSDMPAMPLDHASICDSGIEGLSKREYACIHCGVPQSGDLELDAIIAEGNRIQKAMIEQDLKTNIGITYGSEGS